MNWIIVILLCGSCLFLIIRLNLIKKCIDDIILVLDDILQGNKGRVCHISSNGKLLQKLGQRINLLIEEHQNYIESKKNNEVLTKKLIADISHDIRTPLTSILGYIDVLHSNKSLSEEDKNAYIDIISAKGQSLHKYIDELFEYVKLEADDTVIKLSRENLSEIVRTMLCYFYQDLQRGNIDPLIHMPKEDLYVWGNATSIKRVLQNLISNALHYGNSGNVIGITIREEADKVWVDIWDRGKGIMEEDIKYVFTRMHKFGNSSSQGNGFGLSITKRLIQKMGGEINVYSVPGEKTTFSFFLKKST